MVPQVFPLTVESFEHESSLPMESSSSKRPRFSTTKDISVDKELFIREEVDRRLSQWAGQMNEVDPVKYMGELFKKRGKEWVPLPSLRQPLDNFTPDSLRMESYSKDLLDAVRTSNVEELQRLYDQGVCMNACNRFGESTLHIACRRADVETVRFLLDHSPPVSRSASVTSLDSLVSSDQEVTQSSNVQHLLDDYGRSPLHDVCWRPDSGNCFSLAFLFLRLNPDLLRLQDFRGYTPLHYVQPDQQAQWCAFLEILQDIYWPSSP